MSFGQKFLTWVFPVPTLTAWVPALKMTTIGDLILIILSTTLPSMGIEYVGFQTNSLNTKSPPLTLSRRSSIWKARAQKRLMLLLPHRADMIIQILICYPPVQEIVDTTSMKATLNLLQKETDLQRLQKCGHMSLKRATMENHPLALQLPVKVAEGVGPVFQCQREVLAQRQIP